MDSAPKSVIVKVVAPPERLYSVWIGGSIIASLRTFDKKCITKEQWMKLDQESSLENVKAVGKKFISILQMN